MSLGLAAVSAVGSIFGGSKTPAPAVSGVNSEGSEYNLNDGTAASLINSTPSTSQWLIIGAIVLGGIFLWKKVK